MFTHLLIPLWPKLNLMTTPAKANLSDGQPAASTVMKDKK
jgi:hypothetical protein